MQVSASNLRAKKIHASTTNEPRCNVEKFSCKSSNVWIRFLHGLLKVEVPILTILTMELSMYAGNNTNQCHFNAMGQVSRVMGSGQNECFNDANIFFLFLFFEKQVPF